MEKTEKKKRGRVVAVKHRVKFTVEGKARPTMLAIRNGGGKLVVLSLKTETDEMDWLLGRFPVKFKEVQKNEDISKIPLRHIKWRMLTDDEKPADFPEHFVQEIKGKLHVVSKVPKSYDGLQEGDTVVTTFGGSGDRMVFALARHGEDIGAQVFRVPPHELKGLRDQTEPEDKPEPEDAAGKKKVKDPKANDHKLLLELFDAKPNAFFHVFPRDRSYILVAEAFRAWMDAMKDRMACVQRLRHRTIGQPFLSEDGKYPEGQLEDLFDERKASDKLLQFLIKQEKTLDGEFRKAVRQLDIWTEVMKGLKGLGERHAAGLITAIVDIRRFMAPNGPAKLTKFCGVHVMDDGSLPRKRRGQRCNWNPIARQSLFLLADQWNYRPDTKWGRKLLENKAALRQIHPESITVQVKDLKSGRMVPKMRYNDGHILNMARWRTMTQFIKWLYLEWVRIEEEHREKEAAEAAA